jgi:hypothetical protein
VFLAGRRLLTWVPPTVGLSVSGIVAWQTRPVPLTHSLHWIGISLIALRYVLLVCIAGIIAQWIANAVLTRKLTVRARALPEASAALAWSAPLALLLLQRSGWASVAAAIYVSIAFRFFHSHRSAAAKSGREQTAAFAPAFAPEMFPAVSAALCLQLAALATTIHVDESSEILMRFHIERLVALELSLVNTTLPLKPALSLGTAKVDQPPIIWAFGGGDPGPFDATLSYNVPVDSALHQFDEVAMVFHRYGPISAKSARIAIRQFVLVPRH